MPPDQRRSALDPAKAEAFAETLLGAVNHGALCLMVSIGHRTGLFDIMAALPPATQNNWYVVTK